MKENDIIIPVGIPLGIYENKGRIQNEGKWLEIGKGEYVCWFFSFLSNDLGDWCELCVKNGVVDEKKEILDFAVELENAGLITRFEAERPGRGIELLKTCIVTRQGIYAEEDREHLTFTQGNSRVRIPNVSELKLFWMQADGKKSVAEIISDIRTEGIKDNIFWEKVLMILAKNRLIMLEEM